MCELSPHVEHTCLERHRQLYLQLLRFQCAHAFCTLIPGAWRALYAAELKKAKGGKKRR